MVQNKYFLDLSVFLNFKKLKNKKIRLKTIKLIMDFAKFTGNGTSQDNFTKWKNIVCCKINMSSEKKVNNCYS